MAGSLHEQFQQDACTGVSTAFTIVSIFIVGLRVYTRTALLGNFGKDDWAMLCALVLTIGYLIAIYVLRENGMGFSGATLSLSQMGSQIKTTLAIEILYYVLVFAIKLSILFLYLRFAAEKAFLRWIKITIWVLTVFVTICVVVCLAQCVPLHKMWDLSGMVEGKCINTTAFFYSTSAFNILTDIFIIVLPVSTLLSIQRPNREKLALLIVFGLGVFSTIASIVRLHAIRIYTLSEDPFYDSVPINLWSMIEVNIGIWCASIPALKALISRGQRERSRKAMGYKYHSRERSGTAGTARAGTVGTGRSRSAGMNGGVAWQEGRARDEGLDLTAVDGMEGRYAGRQETLMLGGRGVRRISFYPVRISRYDEPARREGNMRTTREGKACS